MLSGKNTEYTCDETINCIFMQQQSFWVNAQAYVQSSIRKCMSSIMWPFLLRSWFNWKKSLCCVVTQSVTPSTWYKGIMLRVKCGDVRSQDFEIIHRLKMKLTFSSCKVVWLCGTSERRRDVRQPKNKNKTNKRLCCTTMCPRVCHSQLNWYIHTSFFKSEFMTTLFTSMYCPTKQVCIWTQLQWTD